MRDSAKETFFSNLSSNKIHHTYSSQVHMGIFASKATVPGCADDILLDMLEAIPPQHRAVFRNGTDGAVKEADTFSELLEYLLNELKNNLPAEQTDYKMDGLEGFKTFYNNLYHERIPEDVTEVPMHVVGVYTRKLGQRFADHDVALFHQFGVLTPNQFVRFQSRTEHNSGCTCMFNLHVTNADGMARADSEKSCVFKVREGNKPRAYLKPRLIFIPVANNFSTWDKSSAVNDFHQLLASVTQEFAFYDVPYNLSNLNGGINCRGFLDVFFEPFPHMKYSKSGGFTDRCAQTDCEF